MFDHYDGDENNHCLVETLFPDRFRHGETTS